MVREKNMNGSTYTLNGNFGSEVSVILNVTFALLVFDEVDVEAGWSLDAI